LTNVCLRVKKGPQVDRIRMMETTSGSVISSIKDKYLEGAAPEAG